MTLSCCGAGEFMSCDAGVDATNNCASGEFNMCDGGSPDAPPMPQLCTPGGVNDEPEILVGYEPASGQPIGVNGQVKVWVDDECPPTIAPNEQVDPNTGQITMPGNRTAAAMDGYLWEPAVYIAPQSAENGGTPHFPTLIKGEYSNMLFCPVPGFCFPNCISGIRGAPIDPPPPGSMTRAHTAEFIWDISSLGLGPGQYVLEFVIHDGDQDRGVGCITLVIQ